MKRLLLLVLSLLLLVTPAQANFFSGTVTLPVSVVNGGTGAADAATALSNLGLPASVIPGRLARVSVSLTSAAQTTLYTVPAGKTLYVTDLFIEGQTVPTGVTKVATVKVGTTGGSYAELLNGSVGYAIATVTATTLLANGTGFNGLSFYLPATPSVAATRSFVAGTVLKVDVSTAGALPTAGALNVELYGVLL